MKSKVLTHDEYIDWQAITGMLPHEKEEVDHICTSLINLELDANMARAQSIACYLSVLKFRVTYLEKKLGFTA